MIGMNLFVALACGTAGSILGAWANYAVASRLGRWVFVRYGRWVLLTERSLERTERFFARHGEIATFVGRLFPVIRHLISIPAGMASMRLVPFILFTVIGAGLWNSFLAWCGFQLQKNWGTVMRYSHWIDIGVIVLLAALVLLYVGRHLARRRRASKSA